MEHLGEPYPAPYRIRSGGEGFEPRDGEEVGPTPRRDGHFCGVWVDARAGVLLLHAGEAHVGAVGTLMGLPVLLPPTRGMFGSRDCPQEETRREMAVAKRSVHSNHGGLCRVHGIVAVCPRAC